MPTQSCGHAPASKLRFGMNNAEELLKRITQRPGQCGGRPCIRGMRIRVMDILEMLAEGVTEDEILADFPDLERDDIRASLVFASRRASHAQVAA
jgi:uncharacterized protein (DUF433 family)